MSLFSDRPAPPTTYYIQKCRQHIHRVLASYELSKHGVNATSPQDLVRSWPLIFDNSHATDEKLTRMKRLLARSHFALLKVEVELFLHLLILEQWRLTLLEQHQIGDQTGDEFSKAALKRIRQGFKRANESGVVLDQLFRHRDVVEAVLSICIPVHGLGSLVEAGREVGLDIEGHATRARTDIWPQLHVAFQVRHLIEHRNGRIDPSFVRKAGKLWPQSTWGRRERNLQSKKRVVVIEEDLVETSNRSLDLLESLQEVCEDQEERRAKLGLPQAGPSSETES